MGDVGGIPLLDLGGISFTLVAPMSGPSVSRPVRQTRDGLAATCTRAYRVLPRTDRYPIRTLTQPIVTFYSGMQPSAS
jgi:hypothetical protein